MTRTQANIIASIAALDDGERRELIEHLVATHLGEGDFYNGMSPAERTRLSEGLAQAERGEGSDDSTVYKRIAAKLGLSHS